MDERSDRSSALAERLFRDAAGALELYTVYLGERLGLYRALDEGGPATSSELAERTGTTERYVREWLEHHASSGILDVDDPAAASRSCAPPGRSRTWWTPSGPAGRRHHWPGNRRAAASRTGRCSSTCSGPSGCRRSPRSTGGSGPTRRRGWPTPAAVPAGPASAWPSPTRRSRWTASTWTPR